MAYSTSSIVTNKIFDFEPKLKISNLFSMLKKLFTAGCRHLQNTKIEEEFTKNSMHRNVDWLLVILTQKIYSLNETKHNES